MPKVIDNYVLERKIGAGQYGEVYKGFRKQTCRDVAVKVIKRENLKGKFNELLQNQIRVLRTCNNQNIVKLYDLKKTSNNFYLVMEYCNQGDLAGYLKTKKILTEDEAVELLLQIFNAFKTLVENRIIHRDFKPANILKHDGELKIADFGFSKLLSVEDYTTTVLGSPLYMAPEVFGGSEYNNKVDVYSVGAVFFEMLFGRPPYLAPNLVDLASIMQKKPLFIPKKLNHISAVTEDLLKKMLAIDPKNRISWEELFKHPINNLLEEKKIQKMQENLICGSEEVANVSAFYIKENMVIDHPHDISKKESMNNFMIDVVNGKKSAANLKKQIINKSFINQTPPRKTSDESEPASDTKTIDSSNQIKNDSEDEKNSIHSETEVEKNIKIFKKNANKLLHFRNIYVFLASVADDALGNTQMKIGEQIGYLLVRRLLEIIQELKDLMISKEPPAGFDKWKEFTKQKDYANIKQYIEKEHNLFTTFHNTILGKIISKNSIKTYTEDIRELIQNQNLKVNKIFVKKLKQYAKDYMTILKQKGEKKNWVHLERIMDCFDIDKNFSFEVGKDLFNFKQYYDSVNLLTAEELRKRVQDKWMKA